MRPTDSMLSHPLHDPTAGVGSGAAASMVAGAAQLRVLTRTLAATAEAAHNLARVLSDHADTPPRSPLALDSPLSPVRALLRGHAAATHWAALALDSVLAASHSHTVSPPPLAGTLRAAPLPVPNARVPTAAAPHAETVELDLCALLCTLVDATALVGECHQTRVHFVCAEPFCTVRADPAYLARTLLLALGLVLDAAGPGGFLALELHIDADGARLGVEVLPAHAYRHLAHLSPEAAWNTLIGSIARLGCPVSVAPPVSRTTADDLASHAATTAAADHGLQARVPLLGIELTLPVTVVTKAHPPRVGTTTGTSSSSASATASSRGASFPLGATSLLHSTLPWPLGGAAAARADAHASAGEDAASLSFWRFCLQLLLGAQTPSGLAPPLVVGLVAGAGIDSELGHEPIPISPAVDGAVQRHNSFLGVTPRVWSPAWGTFPFQSLANLAYGTDAAGVVAAVDKLPPLVVISNVQVDDMAVMLAALQAQLQGDAKPVTTGPAEDHADPVSKAPSVGVLVHVPDQHGVHAVLRALHDMAWCPSTIAVQIASGCVPVPSLVAHLHDLYQHTRAGLLALRQYAPGCATPAIARDPARPADSPGVTLPLTPVTPNGYASAWTTTPPRSAARNDDASGGGHGRVTSGARAHAPETPISPASLADWTAPVARPPTYTRARSSFRGSAPSPSRTSSPRAATPPMHAHLLSSTSPARPGASPVSSMTAPVLVEPPPRLSRAFTMQDPTWMRRRIDFQAGFPGAPGALAAVGQTTSAQQSGASTPTETSASPPVPAPVRPPGLRRTASRKAVPPPLDIAATISSRLARQEVESARLAAMSAEHPFHPSSSSSSTRATGTNSNDVPTTSAVSAAALAVLPPPPRPAKAYSSPDHRARGGGRVIPPIRVLLVEDNPINLRILTAFLSQRGIRYAAARDGAEAVNVFAAAPPGSGTEFHLVLMDVQLPVMDGLEATRRIRGVEAKWDVDRRAAARRKSHHQSPSPGPTATQGGRRAEAAGPPPPAQPGGAEARLGSTSTVTTAGMTTRRRAVSQPEVAVVAKAAGMRGKQQRSPPTSTPSSPTKKMSPPVGSFKSRSPGAVGISTRVRVRTGGAAARFTAPPGSRLLKNLVRAHADRTSAAAAAAKRVDVDDQSDARPAASGAVPTTTPVPAGCNSIVVALTASSTPDDRKAALQAGCNDFISKPLNLKWLESKIIEWGSIQSIIKFSQ